MPSSLESFLSGPVPPVDPEDIKRVWPLFVWPLFERRGDYAGSLRIDHLSIMERGRGDYAVQGVREAFGIDQRALAERCSAGSNVFAVSARVAFIRAVHQQGLLDKWMDGDMPQDKVFAVAATVPLRLWFRKLKWCVEEGVDFDGEGFIRALEASG